MTHTTTIRCVSSFAEAALAVKENITHNDIARARVRNQIVGARLHMNKALMPIAGLALIFDIAEDMPELRSATSTPDGNLPGRAYYFIGQDDAAKAVGAKTPTMTSWLLAGKIPGAFQPRGKNTTWYIPVDGLWAAGFDPARKRVPSTALEAPAPEYWNGSVNAPLPSLNLIIEEAKRTINNPPEPARRLKTGTTAHYWTAQHQAAQRMKPALSVEQTASQGEATHEPATTTSMRQADTDEAIKLQRLTNELSKLILQAYDNIVEMSGDDSTAAKYFHAHIKQLRDLNEEYTK